MEGEKCASHPKAHLMEVQRLIRAPPFYKTFLLIMLQQGHTHTSMATSITAVGLGVGIAIAYSTRPPTALANRLADIDEKQIEIHNEYEDVDWWESDYPLQLANKARVPYFLRTLREQLQSETLEGKRILDIGCGGGLVTEAIAKQTQAQVIGKLERCATALVRP
jgi:hypothetical protein